ncbi:mechanosensitive ion channel family protein [Fusibacter sp. JL216-2]|uniref:mechanosensitive ion channel family protein n=1 Tax=Fusibacter sp. JL216-2 TaxID=3071453 RepID=UPI003D331DE0
MNHFYTSAIVFFAVFLLTNPVLHIVYAGIERITRRTKTDIDDALVDLTRKPVRFLIKGVSLLMTFNMIVLGSNLKPAISDPLRAGSANIIKSIIIITVCWVFSRLTSRIDHLIAEFKMLFQVELNYLVAPFVSKMLNILVWAIGALMIASEFNFDVTGFVASLGLTGLAVALAGKSMMGNLFGGFAIIGDKTFDIGDWIVADGVEGTVENISMWSTKVRTFDKGLVTVPNELLAGSKILNYSKRDQRRVSFNLGVTYDTPKDKVNKVVERIRAMLLEHEKVSDDLIIVNFENFGASALEIKVYYFTKTSIWLEYLEIREDVNLLIMDILDEEGVEVAFPSMTIYKPTLASE